MDHLENKESNEMKNNSLIKEKNKEGNIQKKQNSVKSNKLQEKLKKLILEREEAKYKYNKQLIPEQLKYNSEDDESNLSDKNDISSKNLQAKTTNNFFNNQNSKISLNKIENININNNKRDNRN